MPWSLASPTNAEITGIWHEHGEWNGHGFFKSSDDKLSIWFNPDVMQWIITPISDMVKVIATAVENEIDFKVAVPYPGYQRGQRKHAKSARAAARYRWPLSQH